MFLDNLGRQKKNTLHLSPSSDKTCSILGYISEFTCPFIDFLYQDSFCVHFFCGFHCPAVCANLSTSVQKTFSTVYLLFYAILYIYAYVPCSFVRTYVRLNVFEYIRVQSTYMLHSYDDFHFCKIFFFLSFFFISNSTEKIRT